MVSYRSLCNRYRTTSHLQASAPTTQTNILRFQTPIFLKLILPALLLDPPMPKLTNAEPYNDMNNCPAHFAAPFSSRNHCVIYVRIARLPTLQMSAATKITTLQGGFEVSVSSAVWKQNRKNTFLWFTFQINLRSYKSYCQMPDIQGPLRTQSNFTLSENQSFFTLAVEFINGLAAFFIISTSKHVYLPRGRHDILLLVVS